MMPDHTPAAVSPPLDLPYNRAFLSGRELQYITQALAVGHLSGDGSFTAKCSAWLEEHLGTRRALLTHSCTGALEMAALLAEIRSGDEVIMPSYTFVSTANAFVLRGGVPIFVDIRPDTLNLDEALLETAITPRTRAIVPVHYAGVACEMDTIRQVARRHGLMVIEDAAQGILSTYRGQPLGALGDLAALSFHETKNIVSGEGGALLINDPALVQRAEIIREKGTNRSQFFRGQVDKYTWCDIGSSYLPGELTAALLWAQLEAADEINALRMAMWNRYHEGFESLEQVGRVRRPVVPSECTHNAHIYYLLLHDLEDRTAFIEHMKCAGIQCVFHYIPLHSSPFGLQSGRTPSPLPVTLDVSDRLVRLPLSAALTAHTDRVIESAMSFLVKA